MIQKIEEEQIISNIIDFVENSYVDYAIKIENSYQRNLIISAICKIKFLPANLSDPYDITKNELPFYISFKLSGYKISYDSTKFSKIKTLKNICVKSKKI